MAEQEPNYTSVVIRSKKEPQLGDHTGHLNKVEQAVYSEVKINKSTVQQTPDAKAKKGEEGVYDEVKERQETSTRTQDTNAELLTDIKAGRRGRCLACCLGILCVVLLFSLIGVCVHLAKIHESESEDLNQLKANQTALLEENRDLSSEYKNLTVSFKNLTQAFSVLENNSKNLKSQNEELQSQNQELNQLKTNQTALLEENRDLSSEYKNLTVRFKNLTQAFSVLENNNKNLKSQNEELLSQQLELQTNGINSTEQIETIKTNLNELRINQSQWSIDAYCPNGNNGRKCGACQKGWILFQSSCYAYNDAAKANQRNWTGARDDCRGKGSDLTAAADGNEKKHVNSISPTGGDVTGYWIGLRAVGGKWKWIDGSDLINQAWIQSAPPVDGQCVISTKNTGWRSVSCADRNAWICEMKALTI